MVDYSPGHRARTVALAEEQLLQITKDNAAGFVARYGRECDGVVVSVDQILRPWPYRTTVVVDTKDAESDWAWCRVRFVVTGVKQSRFEVFKSTFEVLHGDIQIVWKEDLVYVVFDAYPFDGPGLPDLSKNMAFVAGEECYVTIEPV